MDEKTLTALKGSIAKWEAIVAGTGIDQGADNCPLCKLFVKGPSGSCNGCPVSARTGWPDCRGSPYYNFYGERICGGRRLPPPDRDDYAEELAAAQAELDFLKSLLPPA